MHPIERLRFVARSRGAPAAVLVEEAAIALCAFRDDPAGLVAACRRIVDRQLTCGPLWWLCARLLCSPDPVSEARAAAAVLAADPTPARLAGSLPDDAVVVVVEPSESTLAALVRRGDVRVRMIDLDDAAVDAARMLDRAGSDVELLPARAIGAAVGDADLVLLDALACGPAAALAAAGSLPAAAVARCGGSPVWLVAGVGRLMPERMWGALVSRWSASVDVAVAQEEELPLSLVERIVGIAGPEVVDDALRRTGCPVAPELFRLAG